MCETEPDSIEIKQFYENAYVMSVLWRNRPVGAQTTTTTTTKTSFSQQQDINHIFFLFYVVNCHGKTNSATEALKVLLHGCVMQRIGFFVVVTIACWTEKRKIMTPNNILFFKRGCGCDL